MRSPSLNFIAGSWLQLYHPNGCEEFEQRFRGSKWTKSVCENNPNFIAYTSKGNAGRSIAIVLRNPGFYAWGGQNTLYDVSWMWKSLAPVNLQRVRVYKGSVSLASLHTTDPTVYDPNLSVTKGDWREPELLWKWVLYACSQTKHDQKKGKIREALGDSFPGIHKALRRLNALIGLENV